MADFSPGSYDGDDAEERLVQQAEELMRQGRYEDAVARYQDLRSTAPTSLWAILGHASALECAGDVHAAEQILDEARTTHRLNAHVQRFGRMFYERREDLRRAIDCREALRSQTLDDATTPPDQLADLFFNQGRYHEALNELKRILNEEDCSDPQLRASVLARTGACMRQLDNFSEARDHLQQAIALEPESHWTLAELAEVERGLGNPDSARDYYLQALEQNPEDHWCRGHLAQLEFEQGNHGRATELYQAILDAEPKATWALVELAQILTESDPQRAENLCQQALEEDPSYPWAWAQLGALARADGRLDEARRRFQQALQASPTSTWILHELADTCRQLGRLEEAHAHLDHARSINPFDSTSYGYTADILRSQERNQEATQHLLKAVELDSNYTWAWRELAELQALSGNHAEAERAFREACSNEPDDPINDGLHAFLLRCSDRREAALPFLERAVAGMPEYLWAWRELIELHLLAGRTQEAEAAARKALNHLPDQPNLLALLAEALRHSGRREEARAAVATALEHEHNVPQLWALAAELESDNDPQQARSHAERAAQLGQSGEYYLLHAQLTALTGDHQRAADILDQMIAADEAPPLAYDLAADLALQRRDPARARQMVTAGLVKHPGEVRLAVRHATLAVQAGEQGATAQLQALFSSNQATPWRDVAQLFARDGDAISARRAIARLLDESSDQNQRAEAWLAAGEIELHLGQRQAARQAAEQALRHDGDIPGALVLAAMLAEGDAQAQHARLHLAHLDEILLAADPEDENQGVLLRQVALLCERLDEHDRAEDLWQRSLALDDSPAARLEYARACNRRGNFARTLTLLDDTDVGPDPDLNDQLICELTEAHYRCDGLSAALTAMSDHAAAIGPRGRLLWAQLLCADGQLDAADEHLTKLLDEDGRGPLPARLLHIRSLLSRWRVTDAVDAAHKLANDEPNDLDAAMVLAEALAMSGDAEAALAALQAESLPNQRSLNRATLGCCIHLALGRESAAASWLGQHLPQDSDQNSAVLRILNQTLRGAVTGDCPPAQVEDAAQLPPLPKASCWLANQLAVSQPRLAAAICLHGAAVAAHIDQPAAARALRRQAVRPLLRSGQRRLAWASARTASSWLACLRCLLP